jgi:hypothetical protein
MIKFFLKNEFSRIEMLAGVIAVYVNLIYNLWVVFVISTAIFLISCVISTIYNKE